MDYRGHQDVDRLNRDWDRMLESSSYENNFEETQFKGKDLSYGFSHLTLVDDEVTILDPNEYIPNTYFAIVSEEDGKQYVMVKYRILSNDEKPCVFDQNEEIQFFKNIIDNINFS